MTSIGYTCKECGTVVHLTSYQGTPKVQEPLCFRCFSTGCCDKNGTAILLHNTVSLDGQLFEVIRNEFSKELVIDGDTGQALLEDVCKKCEVVRKQTK